MVGILLRRLGMGQRINDYSMAKGIANLLVGLVGWISVCLLALTRFWESFDSGPHLLGACMAFRAANHLK